MVAKRPWIFLVLWIFLTAILAFMLAEWSLSNPSVTNWFKTPQGYFTTSMLGLLMGVTIIIGLQLPKIPQAFFELFSLQLSLKEIRPIWLLAGIAVGELSYLHPRAWHAGSVLLANAVLRGRAEGGLAYIIGAAVLGPIPEELILRGYLYQGFRFSYGRTIGTLIIIVLSIVLHLGAFHWTFYGSFVYGGLAALLCWIFESRKNLLDCILFHIAYNATLVCHTILIR